MQERLEESPLYLAATRPALFFGVPVALAAIFVMGAGLVVVIMKDPLYELVMVPLWMGAQILVQKDYNAISVALLWLRTSGRAIDSPLWGGATVSPNPLRVASRGRGAV
ncbi:MAG TPA: type IV secretion system protein VirB3 [Acidocella sp.]|jgi:type IV secretion system protein VirB3|uniref:type IV secretion system protein VirB3 n=1 Tax=Acidocella sp. TaxID=50710 RepID=UPI002B8158A4|nr:type IV secretion system protein VirB3 [Acidocella sp.]HVE21784.1 type IV secretion system protein VirB3 [Acidocella sp.]